MKRDIKFRAWYECIVYPEESQMLYVGDQRGTTNDLDCVQYLISGQPVTLMQYIGVKDIRGYDVYEGDIVKYSYPKTPFNNQPNDKILIVEYVDCVASFRCVSDCGYEEVIHEDVSLEVLGNIYEHKDMLVIVGSTIYD